MKAGDRVGPWTLLEALGAGGNASVWRATRNGGVSEVAVKFIDTRKTGSERYRRFVQEVGVLRELGSFPGVLPLLDSNLPPQPSATDPAWLSMPVATPIRNALDGAPLETVIEAIAEIAHTLAALAARRISHRDIKPGNLYAYSGHWVVGDFGLVALPDGEALTRNGRRFGPEHYTPHEMVIDPANADPMAADVSMLAKTLWVLATGSPAPPGGHQVANEPGLVIADLRPHQHADALDQLVDRSTRLRPQSRPTMAAFAADLEAWRRLGGVPSQLDVSHVIARVRDKLRAEIQAEDTEAEQIRLAKDAGVSLVRHCEPLGAALRAIDSRAELNAHGHTLAKGLHMMHAMGTPAIKYKDDRFGSLRSGTGLWTFAVSFGWALDLDENGLLSLSTLVYVGREKFDGHLFWAQSPRRQTVVGSIEAEKLIEEMVGEMRSQLHEALKVFAENLP